MITRLFYIFLFISLCSNHAWGFEGIARVDKISGNVHKYADDRKEEAVLLKKGDPLFEGERISTAKDASVFIEYRDGSKVLLKPGTELYMEKEKLVSLAKGRALFRMLKQSIKRFRVRIRTVTIGVRGTTFLTDADEDNTAVYLKEGRLNILSEEGDFKRYKKQELDEFERYKEEFEEYKRKLEEEFIEYVKEFEMEGGTAISIKDNEVRDIAMPPDVEEDFDLLDNPDLI